MKTPKEYILELRRVHQQFGEFLALKNINLQIETGERVALVGASGAGKSTLLHLLNGSLRPTQGEVWCLGYSCQKLSRRSLRQLQQHIGTIYQQFQLVENLRVIHNVNAGHLSRWSFWKAALSLLYPLEVETAAQALKQVGIPEKLYARTARLSGGQQQRVALARVLVQDPSIILADEPISNVDPERSREIIELLTQLSDRTGKTLVVSLHSIDFALHYFERIIGLRQGKIVFDLPPQEVSAKIISQLYRLEP